MIGKIISISELNVKVYLYEGKKVQIKDILEAKINNNTIRFEVISIDDDMINAIPFGSVIGLKKGAEVKRVSESIKIEYSDNIVGRVFDSYGNSLDDKEFTSENKKGIYEKNLSLNEIDINGKIIWTGIKVLDFFAPIRQGFKMGLLGGAGVGKTVLIKRVFNFKCPLLYLSEIGKYCSNIFTKSII